MKECEDAISREEAKNAMYGLCGDGSLKENPWRDNPHIDAIIDALDDIPSVTLQEPFMNKPCVAHQVCHEDKVKILDKIRAEIVELPTISTNANDVYKAQVLQIIDKYKSESEKV